MSDTYANQLRNSKRNIYFRTNGEGSGGLFKYLGGKDILYQNVLFESTVDDSMNILFGRNPVTDEFNMASLSVPIDTASTKTLYVDTISKNALGADEISIIGDVNVQDNMVVGGVLTAGYISISGNININDASIQTLNVTGQATFNSDVLISGTTTISHGDIVVSSGSIEVANDVNVANALNVSGVSTLDSLRVLGNTTFNNSVHSLGTMLVDGSVTFMNGIYVTSGSNLWGTTTMHNNAIVGGSIGVGTNAPTSRLHLYEDDGGADLSVKVENTQNGAYAFSSLRLKASTSGDTILYQNSDNRTEDGGAKTATLRNNAGNLRMQGAGATGGIFVSTAGNVGVGATFSNANLPQQALHVAGIVYTEDTIRVHSGGIHVTGTATFNDHVWLATSVTANNLSVSGNATFNTLSVNNSLNISGTIQVTGNATFNSAHILDAVVDSLVGSGNATFNYAHILDADVDRLIVSGNATFNTMTIQYATVDSLLVTGNASFANSLSVSGNATFANTVAVRGSMNVSGNSNLQDLYLFGSLYVTGGGIIKAQTIESNSTNNVMNIGCDANTNVLNLACASNIQTLNLGSYGSLGETIINIGGPGDTVNIAGSFNYISVTNLAVSDKTLLLNVSGPTGTSHGAGIYIQDGGNTYAAYMRIIDNFDRNQFEFKSSGDSGILTTPVIGSTNSELLAQPVAGAGVVTVYNNLVVTGIAAFDNGILIRNSGLNVSGVASFNNGLEVSGGSIIGFGGLNISGAASFNNGIEVSGGSIIGFDGLNVSGSASFNDNVYVVGAVNIYSGLNVSGSASFNNGLEIYTNPLLIHSGLNVTGSASFNDGLDITGPVNVYASATFHSDACVDATLTVSGTLRVKNIEGIDVDGTLNIGYDTNTHFINIGGSDIGHINIGGYGITGPTVINIGGPGDIVNIGGSMNYISVTNLAISNKQVFLNVSGGVDSAYNAGIFIDENGVTGAGYMRVIDTPARNQFEFKTPADAGILSTPVIGAANYTIVAQNNAGDTAVVISNPLTVTGIVTLEAGLIVNSGFNVTGSSSFNSDLVVLAGLNVTGSSSFNNGLLVSGSSINGFAGLNITGSSSFNGNLGIGNSSPSSALTVSGNVGISGNFSLSGPMNMTGALSVSGRTLIDAVNGGFNVTGSASFNNSLDVLGALNVMGSMSLSGPMNMTGALSVSGRTRMDVSNGGFNVTGSASFNNSLGVLGALNITGSMSLSGPMNMTGALSISGRTLIDVSNGGFNVTGSASFNNSLGVLGGLNVTGSMSLSGPMNMTGALSISGRTLMDVSNGGFNVTGSASFNNSLGVLGALNITGSMSLSGPMNMTGALSVSGAMNFSGPMIITGGVTMNTSLSVSGPFNVTGRFGLSGPMNMTGTLSVSGRTNIDASNGGFSVTGTVNFYNGLNVTGGNTVLHGGSVGILTTPSYPLDVRGDMRVHRGNNTFLINLGTSGNVDSWRTGYLYGNGTDMELNNQNGAIIFSPGNSEKLRISSNGNVGVGTNNPLAPVHIYEPDTAADNTAIRIGADNNGLATPVSHRIVYGNDALSLTGVGCSIDFIRDAGASNSNCSMAFRTNTSSLSGATTDGSVERMRISAAGNVGIGTTTPNSALTVSGSVGISGGMSLSGPMNMTGALSVSGRTLIDVSNGGFNVTGSASFNNSLGVLGALNVTGSMNLSGSMNMTGTLSVSGRMNFSGPVTVTGNISSSGDISGKSLIFSNGGSYVAGSIFSDSNWGCLIRPATSSPANNLFTFAAQDGVEKYVSIGNTGNLGVYVLNPRTRMDIRGPNALYNSDTVRLSIGVSNLILGQVSVIDTSVGPSGEYRGDLTFTTQQNNALSERMRIRYDGNIGIGITGPVSSLHIGNPTDSTRKGVLIQSTLANNTTRPVLTTGTNIGNYEIRAYGNTTSYASDHGFLRISAGGGTNTTSQSSIDMCGFSTVSDMTNTIVMRTAGVERMRIIEGGNVGIGTTGPSQQLHVIGNILASGTITAGSDERFKENIIPIPNALGKVLSLSGVNFTRREDINKKLDIGLIAQNVLGVVPEAVAGTEENMYSVNYQGLVGLLVEAIKEQQNNIENLEHKLETLLSRMDALESK